MKVQTSDDLLHGVDVAGEEERVSLIVWFRTGVKPWAAVQIARLGLEGLARAGDASAAARLGDVLCREEGRVALPGSDAAAWYAASAAEGSALGQHRGGRIILQLFSNY